MKPLRVRLTVLGMRKTFQSLDGNIWKETDDSPTKHPERRYYVKRKYPRGDCWFVSATCGIDWVKPLTHAQTRKLRKAARCSCGSCGLLRAVL